MRQKPVGTRKAVDAVTALPKATVLTHHCRVDGGLTSSHFGAHRPLRLDLFDGSSSWPSPTLPRRPGEGALAVSLSERADDAYGTILA